MPRQATLRLETRGKHRNGYKVDIGTAWILKQCGWSVGGKGREYLYMQPPVGQTGGRTVDATIGVPTDDELISGACKLRGAAETGVRTFEMLYGWPYMYWPAHSVTTSYGEIDLLGLNGPDWVAPPPRIDQREEDAVCRIGFMLIWQAEVRWSDDRTPNLKKYPKLEVKGDEQPLLFGKSNETTQRSGLRKNAESNDPAELLPGDYSEGAVHQIIVNAYERDQGARDACLAHYGTACAVCGFSFFEKYGQIGADFVHVHHLKPLSEIGESYEVDPIRDLRPVCANCHSMLHRQTPCLTIDQLRALLQP